MFPSLNRRGILRPAAWLLCVLLGVSGLPAQEGRLTISPTTAPANSVQTLTFAWEVGSQGMQDGGGLIFEFVPSSGVLNPFFDTNQGDNPEAPGYTRAWTDGGATLQLQIDDGQRDVTVVLSGGQLFPGQHLYLSYTGEVPQIAQPMLWHLRYKRSGAWTWQDVPTEESAIFTTTAAEPEIGFAVVPADVALGEAFELAVVVGDRFMNRADGYRGTVRFSSTDPLAELPGDYTFTHEDLGVHVFPGVRFGTEGFQKILVTDAGGLEIKDANWARVWPSVPPRRRYFGETHFHTGTGVENHGFAGHSGDHRGNYVREEDAYPFVRDVMRLDFATASEHDHPILTDQGWIRIQELADQFYDPGRFTTFYAYEWTSNHKKVGGGQQIVMYRDGYQNLYRVSTPGSQTLLELWDRLEDQGSPVLTIPHVQFATEDNHIWDHHHPGFQRMGEIYSKWNEGGNRNAQSFELGEDNVWTYQHAWAKGYRIGVIGSSDNHHGQPGLNDYTPYATQHGGLAVVIAEANTRDGIWEAFQARRGYATTGPRIYVDLQVEGLVPMGGELIRDTALAGPRGELWVAGTAPIEKVVAVKYTKGRYIEIELPDDDPHPELFHFSARDPNYRASSIYYFRIHQTDGEMAWTSPIWVDEPGGGPQGGVLTDPGFVGESLDFDPLPGPGPADSGEHAHED